LHISTCIKSYLGVDLLLAVVLISFEAKLLWPSKIVLKFKEEIIVKLNIYLRDYKTKAFHMKIHMATPLQEAHTKQISTSIS